MNQNTIYSTDEVCWAVETDDLCDGYGCAPCSIEFYGEYTPQIRLSSRN